jgi:hypothetical protein
MGTSRHYADAADLVSVVNRVVVSQSVLPLLLYFLAFILLDVDLHNSPDGNLLTNPVSTRQTFLMT